VSTPRTGAALALGLATGCFGQADAGGPWVAVESIGGALTPELGPPPAARDPACTLRVVSWNVHLGPDPQALADALHGSPALAAADVVFVQELEAHTDEPSTRASRLAAALGMTWIYAPARTIPEGTHGLAIFSRFPLAAAQVRDLPFFAQPLHPEAKIALGASVVLGDAQLRVVDVHLDVRLGPADRIVQLAPTVHDVAERLVTGGDYNSNPYAWADGIVPLGASSAIVDQPQAAVLDDYLGHAGFATALPPDAETFPFPLASFRCDDLYARGLPILAAGVEHVAGSDHWPVWFDVDVCGA